MDDDQWLSSRDVRNLLNVSRSKAALLCGELPHYRIGRLVRVKRQDLEEYLAERRHEPDLRSHSRPTDTPKELDRELS